MLANSPGQDSERSSSTTAIPPCTPQRKNVWRNPHLPARSLEDSDDDDSDDDSSESFPSPPYGNKSLHHNSVEEATAAAAMQPPPPPPTRLCQDITLLSFGEYIDGNMDCQDKHKDKRKDKDGGGCRGRGGGGFPRGSIDWMVVDCAFCARESCVCGWTAVQQKCMLSRQ